MGWTAITVADVLLEGAFSQDEKDMLTAITGTGASLAKVFDSRLAGVRGVIDASGNSIGAAGTVPDSLRPYFVALVRWDWLVAFPNLTQLQTDARKDAAKTAEDLLLKIATWEISVEPAAIGINPSSGQWNSETKVQMRTHGANAH